MKSYFIDEVRSFKNETTASQNNNSVNNIEGKTTLRNKIKLLETENKLIKDDNSNKQKFIDIILVCNSVQQ